MEPGRGKRKRFAVFTSDDSDSDELSCALPPPFRLRSCSSDGPSQRNTLPSSTSTAHSVLMLKGVSLVDGRAVAIAAKPCFISRHLCSGFGKRPALVHGYIQGRKPFL
ncbi:uncharacterized protein LOC144107945 [Amblyomma americanum]